MLVDPRMTSCCSVLVSLCATRTSDRVMPPTMNTTMRRPREAETVAEPGRLDSLPPRRGTAENRVSWTLLSHGKMRCDDKYYERGFLMKLSRHVLGH
jgi:hypothetical protein